MGRQEQLPKTQVRTTLVATRTPAFLIETAQDLLHTKTAANGCKQAIVTRGVRLPIFVEVRHEEPPGRRALRNQADARRDISSSLALTDA